MTGDSGARKFLESCGYSRGKIERILDVLTAEGRLGSEVIHPVEREAFRVLAGWQTSPELWNWARQGEERRRRATEERAEREGHQRFVIVEAAEAHHIESPTLTRDQILKRIESGLPARPEMKKFARAVQEVAHKLNRRTVLDWIKADCPAIPAPRGRSRKGTTATRK